MSDSPASPKWECAACRLAIQDADDETYWVRAQHAEDLHAENARQAAELADWKQACRDTEERRLKVEGVLAERTAEVNALLGERGRLTWERDEALRLLAAADASARKDPVDLTGFAPDVRRALSPSPKPEGGTG